MRHRGRFTPILITAEMAGGNGKSWKAINLATKRELTTTDPKKILREMPRHEIALFWLERIGRYGRL